MTVLSVLTIMRIWGGWNDSENLIPTPNPNTFLSVGLGLLWQMDNCLSARLDWGAPLTRFQVEGNTLAQQSLYFSVNWQLF